MGLHHNHHHHGASCSHGGSSEVSQSSTRNISLALFTNMSFAVVELIGGYWTHSTAIQADAIHDLGDSAALIGALLLQLIAALPPRAGYHFGFRRVSLMSAVMTSILLVVGSLFVVKQAIAGFNNPAPLHLNGMLFLAILGVAANGYAAWQMSRGQTQNEKAMAWHMIEDLMGWAAILVSSIVLRFWDAPWLDPLLAMAIAVIVFFGAGRSLWNSLRLFLQAMPKDFEEAAFRKAILTIFGVTGIDSLQIWSLDGESHVCAMVLRVAEGTSFVEWKKIRHNVAHSLDQFGKFELTIEPVLGSLD